MRLINLTPHTIDIYFADSVLHIEPSGTVARCGEIVIDRDPIVHAAGTIPVVEKRFGDIEYLDSDGAAVSIAMPTADIRYIVSALVLQGTARQDHFAPGDPVRDDKGRIIGCSSLCAK